MLGSKSANIGLQKLWSIRKARIWRAFLIDRKKFSETRNGWLGREDSNLRMGESKSPALPLGDAPIDRTGQAAEYRRLLLATPVYRESCGISTA
jgi:hypothetical protein